uniref:RNA helicase n=1 Tax=Strigamia maritima TaxID=126957 RepID=T1IMR9_STRMM
MTTPAIRRNCNGFLDFLKSNGLGNDDSTKEKLRDVYNRQYKISVNFRLPSFSQMLFNLKRCGLVRLKDGEYIHFTNKNRFSNRKNIKIKQNDVNKELPGTSEEKQGSKGKKSKDKKVFNTKGAGSLQLSVDQHVALRSQKLVTCDIPSPLTQISTEENPFCCALCAALCNTRDQLEIHRTGYRHKFNCLKFKFDLKKSFLVKNKDGVSVSAVNVTSYSQEDGVIELGIQDGEVKRFNFEVKNDGKGPVVLHSCVVLKHRPGLTLDDHQGVSLGLKTVQIAESEKYVILATCNGRSAGYESIPILFQFSRDDFFRVLRTVVIITDTTLTKQLLPKAPFKPPPRATINSTVPIFEPGLPLDNSESQDELKKVLELKFYNIPANLKTLNNHGMKFFTGITDAQKIQLSTTISDFESKLAPSNYCRRLRNLLHLEEIQMQVDIRCFDMPDCTMSVVKQKQHMLQLEVPGLAESRPSLIRGDKIYAKKASDRKEFEGIVHVVRLKDVWVGFGPEFRNKFVEGLKFNVRFTVNRLPVRIQHRAVDMAEDLKLWSFLFPTWDESALRNCPLLKSKFRFYNRLIENNLEQQQAVRHVVAGTSKTAPYIIYGPPGTGKTVTLVEAIKQVLVFYPNAHVLACAPTNSATDLIAEKLIENNQVSKEKILRMHALTRHFEAVPLKIRNISNYKDDKYFLPPRSKMGKYQVVVTTLVTAGRLVSAGFPPSHFTHLFIDESGQAVEPEAIVPIAGLLESIGKNGQIVLVGDPKQLGPILRSPIAIKHGLGTSLLERLMQSEPYLRQTKNDSSGGTYNSNIITKLIRNYRSHPSILKVPNELFYDDELLAFADELARNQLAEWERLPRKGFPIIFHGVVGKDEQEERSPSFFNRSEIDIVIRYIADLLSGDMKPEHIGVISPYNRQVQKIKAALKFFSYKREKMKEIKDQDPTKVTVGTTEEFQGQERKRFNVAVTRAKCLLIMIGNPHLLQLDPNWDRYLDFCLKNKAYTGCYYSPNDIADELMQKLNNLKLGKNLVRV